MSSGSGRSATLGAGLPQKKRSIGSVYLDIDLPTRGASKSRRTSPGPGSRIFGTPGGELDDVDDFQDLSYIDLTG